MEETKVLSKDFEFALDCLNKLMYESQNIFCSKCFFHYVRLLERAMIEAQRSGRSDEQLMEELKSRQAVDA